MKTRQNIDMISYIGSFPPNHLLWKISWKSDDLPIPRIDQGKYDARLKAEIERTVIDSPQRLMSAR
ncbi:MAG TPA: hypothetical protein VJW77_11975 [Terriglobia bacterium]|nr:hypothetical protein [Terriglobia bacterium]